MGSIGQINLLQHGTTGNTRQSSDYGGRNYDSNLRLRLDAIDNRGDTTAVIGGKYYASNFHVADNWMSRIEAIGTGELSPKNDAYFDIKA